MSFSDAEDSVSKQDIELKLNEDLSLVPLDFVKFQNISHLSIFIESNHGSQDITKVSRLILYGAPIAGLDMGKLKKIPRWKRFKKQKPHPIPRVPTNTTPPDVQRAQPQQKQGNMIRRQNFLDIFRDELLLQAINFTTNDQGITAIYFIKF